jgi:hypothetical protein
MTAVANYMIDVVHDLLTKQHVPHTLGIEMQGDATVSRIHLGGFKAGRASRSQPDGSHLALGLDCRKQPQVCQMLIGVCVPLCSVVAVHLIVTILPLRERYSALLMRAGLAAGVALQFARSSVLSWVRHGYLARPVLMVGTGPDVLSVGQTIEHLSGFALLGDYPTSEGEPPWCLG